jgi:NAD(P)-dependent dehydrogenase (short-subunit alcohol dehydrogenase family)
MSSSVQQVAAVVIITGGGGFLGQCLASSLLETKTIRSEKGAVSISKLVLADIAFPPTLQPAIELEQSSSFGTASIVKKLQGDVSDKDFCNTLYAETEGAQHVSVFHLGAVMSGDGERDFDLCMRVNFHGFLNMMEGARHHVYQKRGCQHKAKFIFTSAGATIGCGAPTDYITKEDTISDASRATPHTTYGATKACCELFLTDYARRGFVDARALRLPTIVVRAGTPNAATTSCFSSVIREPLSGIDVELPIAKDVPHAVTGKRAAIAAMLLLHDAPLSKIEDVLGFDRTIFLPAVALSLGDLEQALYTVVGITPTTRHATLGKISYKVDEHLSAVVGSFPTKIDAHRAIELGIPPPPTAEMLVREYMTDFSQAVVSGIDMVPTTTTTTPTTDDDALPSSTIVPVAAEKVAVITGAGSGIGRAVAERLSRGGWTVVLAGRTMSKLQETAKLLLRDDDDDDEDNNPNNAERSLCLKADVSIEKDVECLFQTVEQTYGRVDLLFNNAGVGSTQASVQDVSYADFERVIQTNVNGPFLCARAAMRIMAKHGGGRIINNGSISAHVPRPGSACYTTSKHALAGLTKCIALDGRTINVACGQIDFGNVVSEMSLATNQAGRGALQADGTYKPEPSMTLKDAAETFWCMTNLPLEANILQMTVMATGMPFVGRG